MANKSCPLWLLAISLLEQSRRMYRRLDRVEQLISILTKIQTEEELFRTATHITCSTLTVSKKSQLSEMTVILKSNLWKHTQLQTTMKWLRELKARRAELVVREVIIVLFNLSPPHRTQE